MAVDTGIGYIVTVKFQPQAASQKKFLIFLLGLEAGAGANCRGNWNYYAFCPGAIICYCQRGETDQRNIRGKSKKNLILFYRIEALRSGCVTAAVLKKGESSIIIILQ
ncbi:MAG: hypothetical protein GTO45_36125 [Candidatus Aminicenantes bacterium]|nr:hypothetical protein [Candidatus Aminicenantes bacterium]NIM84129.1 hypothetical protein [Candidatus Aminicenantes bacterium]NIN23577.1 hypothetical protein [Candidatus Aminicenantes bacterium]NIN47284.1 hypothetical protein [Candidatus Aminicenantes bacterium]NIN90213.1 hypothetical protein [Candidatus Aminicenantes bacterium]